MPLESAASISARGNLDPGSTLAETPPVADQKYPDLVTQKPHGVGLEPEHSFEDALRDLVRNSPYLGISLLLHAVVLVIMFSMKSPVVVEDPNRKIVATAEDIEEPIPPEPPEEEPEPEEIEEVIEEPVVAEEVVTQVDEIIDNITSDLPFDNTGKNDVLGVGGGAGGGFGRRGKAGQRGKVAGKPYVAAVEDALIWLKNHQNPDGYWASNEFDLECGKLGNDGPCTGLGFNRHDVGVSGLALLAFLGADNTDTRGRHKETVKNGLKYLLTIQDRQTGNFADPLHLEHSYDHMLATLAVVEAFALTGKFKYKKAAQKGLDYMYELRNPGAAWRYADPSDPQMIAYPNDTSATGWAIMAMTMAKDYDLNIDTVALDDAYDFIDEVTDSNGRTGYFDQGGGSSRLPGLDVTFPVTESEAMTAVAVLCRIFADPNFERAGNEVMVDKGIALMQKLPIEWSDANPGRRDFYYWYYATYSMYQVGGRDWNTWQEGIKDIADHQIGNGEMKGSWDPQVDPWGAAGGRVYSTAILALLMEVYYRYDTVIGSH